MNRHFLKKKNGMLVDVLRMSEIDEKYGLFCNEKRGSSAPCPSWPRPGRVQAAFTENEAAWSRLKPPARMEPCRVSQPSGPFATPSRGARSGDPAWGRPRGDVTGLGGRSDKSDACSARWGPAVVDRLTDRHTDRCRASARERGPRHLSNQTDECSASARERGPRHSNEKGEKERSCARNGKLMNNGRTDR